jgi:hypothetical protein
MTKDEMIRRYYVAMSGEDRHTFNRWLAANAAVGCLLTFGLIAMAVFSGRASDADLRDQASARSIPTLGLAHASNRLSDRRHAR